MVFGGNKAHFSQEQDGFVLKSQLFHREKMVLGVETQLFPGDNKKHMFWCLAV